MRRYNNLLKTQNDKSSKKKTKQKLYHRSVVN